MKLYEDKLSKIVAEIEKYGVVNSVKIINGSGIMDIPRTDGCVSISEVNLFKPYNFSIEFQMGDIKEDIINGD